MKAKVEMSLYSVIKNVVLTEKSSNLSPAGIFSVVVDPRSDKRIIKKAFEELYGVTVSSVRIINTPDKSRSVRGRKGIKSGVKKALVSVGVGNTINFNKVS